MPPCVVGGKFVAEPVPTDVEVGPRGKLYVSTLPGGPEDPSFGARGSVYEVNPWNGRWKQVATGFAGATNLAVTPWGTIYVSELFGNQISKVVGNHGVPLVSVPSPAGLEWFHGKLVAGIDAFASGKIVTITP
jgi:sugar lactone lactonase YvrE